MEEGMGWVGGVLDDLSGTCNCPRSVNGVQGGEVRANDFCCLVNYTL